jgi:hypothetical protein
VSTPELASVRVMSPTTRPPAEPDRFESELWTIVGHMASALLVYGGIGYLLARWLHHPILLLLGLVFGLVLSLGYTVWLAGRGGRLHR